MTDWTPCAEQTLGGDVLRPENPCYEEKLDSAGGFLVPASIKDSVLEFLKTGGVLSFNKEHIMDQYEYSENSFLNMDQVSTWAFRLFDICPQLTEADVFNVVVYVELVNGDEVIVDDKDRVETWARQTCNQGNRNEVTGKKTLAYYVLKMQDYYKTVNEKRKEAK